MKCIKCGKEAKWESDKYISPLCDECAIKEVKRLVAETGEQDEIGVSDWYNGIVDLSQPITEEIFYGNKSQ